MKNWTEVSPFSGMEEDAPATSTAGVVGTGDSPVVVVKKKDADDYKKRNKYDGRTREGKKFVERMNARRKKREEMTDSFRKKVEEKMEDFGNEYLLAENNLDVINNVVKKKQMGKVKTSDGKTVKMDLYTASAIKQVYDAVNSSNKEKMEKMLNGNAAQIKKIADFALSKVK